MTPADRSPYLTHMGLPDWPLSGVGALLDAALGPNAPSGLRAVLSDALAHHALAPPPGTVPRHPPAARHRRPPRPAPDDSSLLLFIDEGLTLADPKLRDRLCSIWVQDGAPRRGNPVHLPFGREIPGALVRRMARRQSLDPVDRLHDRVARPPRRTPPGTVTTRDRLRETATHGAAVQGLGTAGDGIAHPVASVCLPPKHVRDTSGTTLPFFALCALLHGMVVARELGARSCREVPVIATFSYGVLAGARDGSAPLTRAFDALCNPSLLLPGLGPIHLVLPMGNGRQSRTHAQLDAPEAQTGIALRLPPEDHTPTFVEIAGDAGDCVTLTAPNGLVTSLPLPAGTAPEGAQTYPLPTGTLLALPATAPKPDSATDPVIPAGTWRLALPNASGAVDLTIQRDESLDGLASGGRQARFLHPNYATHDIRGVPQARDPSTPCPLTRLGTWNAFARGTHVWRAGGCFRDATEVPYGGLDDHGGTGHALARTDQSPRRWGIPVPSVRGGAPVRMNGTSLAAPQMARAIADYLAARGTRPTRALLAAHLCAVLPGSGTPIHPF